MNTYFVEVKVVTDSLRKATNHLIKANTEQEAKDAAILAEFNGELGKAAHKLDDDSFEDVHNDVIYSIKSVTEVSAEDSPILMKLMSIVEAG